MKWLSQVKSVKMWSHWIRVEHMDEEATWKNTKTHTEKKAT